MSKQELILKQLTYEDFIYYNGKCKERRPQVLELKAGKLDYFVLFKNGAPYDDLFVHIKEKPTITSYRLMENFNDYPIIIDELLKIYDEITIKEIELFRDEEIELYDYIKKHFRIIKEEITDHQIVWRNGKNVESVDITIKMKEDERDTRVIKGTYEDYELWLGQFYVNEKKEITERIKNGELDFFLILNKDKYLDHFYVDKNDDNKIDLLLYFETIVNNHKKAFKEFKKYYDHISFVTDSSFYDEATKALKDNYEVIEEKKISYPVGEDVLERDFIKIKL